MKRKIYASLTVLGILLLFVSCKRDGGLPITTGSGERGVIFFSWPFAYLMDEGTINYEDYLEPMSDGTDITDATVTVRNDDTEAAAPLLYNEPNASAGETIGYYTTENEFSHNAGQNVSSEIIIGENTYSGSSTETNDTSTTVTDPAVDDESRTQPFDITWDINSGTTPDATHAIIYISNWNQDPWISAWDVVSLDQGTYEIDGFPAGGPYIIQVFPVNKMDFSGDADIVGYVGTTVAFFGRQININ